MSIKIEKKFYDLMKAQMNQLSKEKCQQEEELSETEREAEKLKVQNGLQEIFQKSNEYRRKWKWVPSEEQVLQFQKISEQALWMAEYISCNIAIEEKDSLLGKIVLESENFAFASPENRAVNKVFSDLFLLADDVFISISPAGLCQMEFCFQLYQPIPTE